jgi:hypothetical protein
VSLSRSEKDFGYYRELVLDNLRGTGTPRPSNTLLRDMQADGIPAHKAAVMLIRDHRNRLRESGPMRLKWHQAAGGTGAHHGHSYTAHGDFGEYHIWPPTTRHGSYHLMWADTRSLESRGLWHDLGRFRSPNEAKGAASAHAEHVLTKDNPSPMDHVDNAVGHFVNEHPWISAMIGATALGAAGYVGVLITQAIIRQTPASSVVTSGSDSSKGPTSTTSTSSTSTSSAPTYDAAKAVPLYIQNAGKEVPVGTSLLLLDASTGQPVNGAVEGSADVLEVGPTIGTYVAVAPGTVKIYSPDGMSTTVVVKAASGTAGVAISPRRPQPRIRGLTSLLFGPALASGA